MRRFWIGLAVGAGLAFGLATAAFAQRPRRAPAPEPAKEAAEEAAVQVHVTPEMVRYSYTRYALSFAGSLAGMLALLFLLESELSARLRDFAERTTRRPLLQAFLYFPSLLLVKTLLLLPLSFYSGFLLPHQYRLSTQTPGAWALDGAKSFGISAALGAPVVALLYGLIRRSPRWWWLAFWAALVPLMCFFVLLAPLVLDPVFNRFEPLRDAALRDRILALARRAGIDSGRVYQVDASRRTRMINAYVTGLSGSTRIVLWDTLLERMEPDEVAFVMAHEMGHYVERHVPLLLGIGLAGSLGVLFIVDRSARRLLALRAGRWRVRGLEDMASLPAVGLLVAALNFVGSPVESAISRTFETRADTFALRLTNDGRAAASAYVKLSEGNLSLPDPPRLVYYWMYSHPSLKERIDRALAWPSEAAGGAPGERE